MGFILRVAFINLILFISTSSEATTAEKDIFRAEAEMRKLEDDKLDPYLGGYNSANAHFIQVTMSTSPEFYRTLSFKETIRNFQDLLVTGGINTNVFLNKKREYRIDPLAEKQVEQVTFVVNTREQATRVSQFFREYQAPQVKSVKVTAGKDQVVIEQFDIQPKKESKRKRSKKKKNTKTEL